MAERGLGNCLIVASLMSQGHPDSINLSTIKAEAAAISADCVGELGVGGASTDLGVQELVFVAVFWKNPNVSRLPSSGEIWTQFIRGCMRGAVRGVTANPYRTMDIVSCLNDASGGPDTDCGPVAGYCKADTNCCGGLICAAKAVINWPILFGTEPISIGGIGSCIVSQSVPKLKPRATIERKMRRDPTSDKESTAKSWTESRLKRTRRSPPAAKSKITRAPRHQFPHVSKLRSHLTKRASCNNDIFGSPTTSHCVRAFLDVPNPAPGNNIEIQFVPEPVDAPINSPIYQLPKLFAHGIFPVNQPDYTFPEND
ncbi:MAG: hypothetical protein M1812_007444 [Candelaria pacifica]|nr:MAG: hypothetical protein M1812_007444 [Candelaria pacifica]